MRPIDVLMTDVVKASSEGKDHILINRAELRQLKDYELVMGTDNPDVAVLVGDLTGVQLHVVDNLP